jgi:hypothetical protein
MRGEMRCPMTGRARGSNQRALACSLDPTLRHTPTIFSASCTKTPPAEELNQPTKRQPFQLRAFDPERRHLHHAIRLFRPLFSFVLVEGGSPADAEYGDRSRRAGGLLAVRDSSLRHSRYVHYTLLPSFASAPQFESSIFASLLYCYTAFGGLCLYCYLMS